MNWICYGKFKFTFQTTVDVSEADWYQITFDLDKFYWLTTSQFFFQNIKSVCTTLKLDVKLLLPQILQATTSHQTEHTRLDIELCVIYLKETSHVFFVLQANE